MKLNLERPICFFDTESTGKNIATDRIVSISVLKQMPDGEVIGRWTLVNPTIPIPPEITLIHGITDEMVKDKPTFKNISKSLAVFMGGCDLAGYNCHAFDVPLLCEEFFRCGIDFPAGDVRCIDLFNIFRKKEPRDLSAALKFYCNEQMEDAHSSSADTLACKKILEGQMEHYQDLPQTVQELYEFSKMDNRVDFAGKIILDKDGDYVYNFGKAFGTKIKNDTGFGEWMLKQSFLTSNTKAIVKNYLEKLAANHNTGEPF